MKTMYMMSTVMHLRVRMKSSTDMFRKKEKNRQNCYINRYILGMNSNKRTTQNIHLFLDLFEKKTAYSNNTIWTWIAVIRCNLYKYILSSSSRVWIDSFFVPQKKFQIWTRFEVRLIRCSEWYESWPNHLIQLTTKQSKHDSNWINPFINVIINYMSLSCTIIQTIFFIKLEKEILALSMNYFLHE